MLKRLCVGAGDVARGEVGRTAFGDVERVREDVEQAGPNEESREETGADGPSTYLMLPLWTYC